MRIITIIPVLHDAVWTKLCLDKIKSDIIIIDNGADEHVKAVIEEYPKIINKENIFVNPAWNQALCYFMASNYDLMALICSDVVMMDGWEDFVLRFFDGQLMIPTVINGIPEKMEDLLIMDDTNAEVNEAAGLFFVFNKKMARIVYPIPETIKIWFGDNWIIKRLKAKGCEVRQYKNLYCMHGNSRSLAPMFEEGIKIIEQDKIEWMKITESYL